MWQAKARKRAASVGHGHGRGVRHCAEPEKTTMVDTLLTLEIHKPCAFELGKFDFIDVQSVVILSLESFLGDAKHSPSTLIINHIIFF